MAPTILVAGATGNTGRSVVKTLSNWLETNSTLSGHRIIALTRSSSSPVAQGFATLPGVEVVEKNWATVTADWLREHEVVRAFIASHNEPNQFAEESTFHLAALEAGVKYIVRISTTASNVRPDCKAYYARSHWAIENLLGTPEFEGLQWTSLQPNAFSQLVLASAAELIKLHRKTGKQNILRIIESAEAPVGIIDPDDIGVFAAHLLAQQDPTSHNKAKYILNGPEDVTGNQIVKMVEQYIGTKVENVSFKDMTFVDTWAKSSPDEHLILTIKHAMQTSWDGLASASTTSKEVLELAAPRRTPAEVLKSLLEE
ncbi:NAD(P)-binding protein [Xylariaceae sp. AK1471]|nr:NAD(P)-binding protein [Xylariaceae sp. AK1471]